MYFWYWYFPYTLNKHQCSIIETSRTGVDKKAMPDQNTATYGIYERTYKISECPICKKEYPYDFSQFERVKTITFQELFEIRKLHD